MPSEPSPLELLQTEIVACGRCPRLVNHCHTIAEVKRRAYRDEEYWGKPLPSFGDPSARLLVIGLAPAAHGGNRTGRMFTGDRSGDFLYKVLHETGFASHAQSRFRGDGLILTDAYITAVVRCAPPDNKPSPDEMRACREYLVRELDLLASVRVVVALGKIAFDAYLSIVRQRGIIQRISAYRFAHAAEHRMGAGCPMLISSYHPSQQNTSTGRLTEPMLRDVFLLARRHIGAGGSSSQ